MSEEAPQIEEMGGQKCPMCAADTLTLREMRQEIPYFGPVYLFSMTCTSCKYHKSDVETERVGEPAKHSFEIDCEDDMKVRVIKSADATVKIPRMITIEPGSVSSGYISNIEGVLNRVKSGIESARDMEEDPSAKKKAKTLLKKLTKVMWGQEKLTVIIEDPTGNSAIISEKTKVTKLK